MKVFLVAMAGMVWAMGANAWTYTYKSDIASSAVPGEVCANNGYKIVLCECGAQTPSNPKGVSESCAVNGEYSSSVGFKLREYNGKVAYCMFESAGSNICANYCGCDSIYGSWGSVGSNRVSRQVTAMRTDSYYCGTSGTTTEYGCAAGYYKSAGSGSSMTCSPCPSPGTNANGETAITSCCVVPNKSITDSSGTYAFTDTCCYTN